MFIFAGLTNLFSFRSFSRRSSSSSESGERELVAGGSNSPFTNSDRSEIRSSPLATTNVSLKNETPVDISPLRSQQRRRSSLFHHHRKTSILSTSFAHSSPNAAMMVPSAVAVVATPVPSTVSISLKRIWEIGCQRELTQHQIWALVHQSVLTLCNILSDQNEHDLSDGNSSPPSLNYDQLKATVRKIGSFSQIMITQDGSVAPETWLTLPDDCNTMQHQTDDHEVDDDVFDDEDRQKSFSPNVHKLINDLVGSLSSAIYSLLIINMNEDEEPDLSDELEELFKFMLKIDANENQDDDTESDEEIRTLSQPQVDVDANNRPPSGATSVDDEGYIDSVGNDDDHFVQAILDKCCAHFRAQQAILEKRNCDEHDSKQGLSNEEDSKYCHVLAMLIRNHQESSNAVNVNMYYSTICQIMFDETIRLEKLLDQFDHESDRQNLGNLNRSKSQLKLNTHHVTPCTPVDNTENLKVWASTWIKVMSEMKFGVHLRPVTPLEDDDDSNCDQADAGNSTFMNMSFGQHRTVQRQRLWENGSRKWRKVSAASTLDDHLMSAKEALRPALPSNNVEFKSVMSHNSVASLRVPVVTAQMIQQRKQELKPQCFQKPLKPPPPRVATIHERLMAEINTFSPQRLNVVFTQVKPSLDQIRERYLDVQHQRSKNRQSISSPVVTPRVHHQRHAVRPQSDMFIRGGVLRKSDYSQVNYSSGCDDHHLQRSRSVRTVAKLGVAFDVDDQDSIRFIDDDMDEEQSENSDYFNNHHRHLNKSFSNLKLDSRGVLMTEDEDDDWSLSGPRRQFGKRTNAPELG